MATRAFAARATRPRASPRRAPAPRAARSAAAPRARSRGGCVPATRRSARAARRCRRRRPAPRSSIVRCRPDRSSCIAPLREHLPVLVRRAAPRSCSRSHGRPSRVDSVEIDLGDELDRPLRRVARLRRCRASSRACRASRRARASASRHALRRRSAATAASTRARVAGIEQLGQPRRERLDARREVRDRRAHVVGQPARAQEPRRAALELAARCRSASPTARRRRPCCRAPRSPSTAARSRRSRAPAGRRARSRAACAPVVSISRCTNVLPTRLTMLLVTCVAMISRFSGCRGMYAAYALAQRRREIARAARSRPTDRPAAATRAARRRARSCCRRAAPRARALVSPLPLRAALGDLLVGRQELDRAVEPPALLEELDEALLRVERAAARCGRSTDSACVWK